MTALGEAELKYLWLLIGLILAACAQRDEGVYTESGKYLGDSDWQSIEAAESGLLLPDVLLPIVEARRMNLADRLVEEVTVQGAWLQLVKTAQGGFYDSVSDSQFADIFDSENKRALRPERKGQIIYAVFTEDENHCIYFRRPVGRPQPHARGGHATHTGLLVGVYCGDPSRHDWVKRALVNINAIKPVTH